MLYQLSYTRANFVYKIERPAVALAMADSQITIPKMTSLGEVIFACPTKVTSPTESFWRVQVLDIVLYFVP